MPGFISYTSAPPLSPLPPGRVRLRFMGTGTSQGIPIIGCRCPVCRSVDPRDKRFRSSVLVEFRGKAILVDAGPDFRSQMIREDVGHLDAVLLTHSHKDHTGGLDDLRSLNYIDRRVIDIYCEQRVEQSLEKEYGYAFAPVKYPGAPEWHIRTIDENPFAVHSSLGEGSVLEWVRDIGYRLRTPGGELVSTGEIKDMAPRIDDPAYLGMFSTPDGKGVEVIPVRGMHGSMPVLGFRFGPIAYITDMSVLPEEEMTKLRGLEAVTLNTVGYRKHHSHFSLEEAVELAGRIGARRTYLTHLSHNFPTYARFREELEALRSAAGVEGEILPSYDGLVLECDDTVQGK